MMSAFVDAMPVMCAKGSLFVFSLMNLAMAAELSVVVPNAPYVTLIKSGFNVAKSCEVSFRLPISVSRLGGNTSKESVFFCLSMLAIFIVSNF